MAKHRKTKKQKQIADRRRQLLSQPQAENSLSQSPKLQDQVQVNPTFSFNSEVLKTPKKINYQMLYPFFAKDLLKTASVTLVILVAYLLIYFSLNNHILALPHG